MAVYFMLGKLARNKQAKESSSEEKHHQNQSNQPTICCWESTLKSGTGYILLSFLILPSKLKHAYSFKKKRDSCKNVASL